ncbi:MAG: sigma-70 family RNA polymerase sigma factor [Bacteroidota bacterium]|nr:sigma-70 family RNA polymerase sigma factor [Bacteroidota bacterium]
MRTKTILPSEPELIALLKARDERGLRVLYDHYSAALYGVILRIVIERETAEDVLQESFVKIWNNSASYDASKGRLYTWLLNVARNTAIDKTRSKNFRKKGQVQSIEDFVYSVDKQHNNTTPVDHIGLRKFVDELKPDQRQLIDLLYFGGYTQSEAAEELNLPLGTVKTRVKAALTQLREILK